MVLAERELGQSLIQDGRWLDARAAFEHALREEASPEALFGLAQAQWWLGDVQASVSSYQRAYAGYRDRGDSLGAAWAAISLCTTYKCCLGNEAAASGWLARAETAAREGDSAPVQGWLWAMRGYLAMDSDLQLASELMGRARDCAASSGDRDLELVVLGDLGIVLARSGRIEEGLRHVDEAMAGVSAGEHSRLDTVVWVCCIMLMACELASDIERASQWSKMADEFTARYGCPFLHAECRARYGAVLLANGRWGEAERELTAAISLTEGAYPTVHASAVSHLADLMTRKGLIEEAEGLLQGHEQELPAALPLAAIKLIRGQPSMAMALVERALRSRATGFTSARALEMLVEIHLAVGDRAAARQTLTRLEATRVFPEASARASMASGRIARANGDVPAALGHFETAMERFSRIGLPMESARARLAIAEAYSNTNPDLARIEAQGALSAFEALGAVLDARATSALLRILGVPTRSGPRGFGVLTRREQEVLRLLSSGLSNPEIAERLVISRKTAAHHVSSLLSKLALRNRAEAVAYAARVSRQSLNTAATN
ncbi:MAG: LuxR family transcriptional regulator [Chloroflexi bacterium]|nr:LuxR family transcriptional regulator [Chloroflexota bacterium]